MTVRTLTEHQLDLICDLQDERDDLAELTEAQAAEVLCKEGHPDFPPLEGEAEKPKAKKKRSRRAKAAQAPAPAPQPIPAAELVPDLDTGKPLDVDPAQVEQKLRQPARPAAEREERPQLPAKVDSQPQLPAKPAGGIAVEGMEHLTGDDLVVPALQLKQAQTQDEGGELDAVPDGTWFLTNDPEEAAERAAEGDATRTVAFLDVRPGRSFLLPYLPDDRAELLAELGLADLVDAETNVVCQSLDRITPQPPREGQEWEPFDDSCEACSFSKWTTGAGGGRKPPRCGENYRGVVADLTDGGEAPARIFLRSTAIRPTKALLTNLATASKTQSRKQARKAKAEGRPAPQPLPMAAFAVELGSKKVKAKGTTYYVPAFGRPRPLEDEDLVESLRDLRASLIEQAEGQPAQAEG